MLVSHGSREDAIHALMNMWLKQPQRWCVGCNAEFNPLTWPCCDDPYLTTNQLVFKRFVEDMKRTREEQANKFGSTQDKSMRYLLRFPPGLCEFLEMSMQRMYNEKLFTPENDQIWFAKKFGKYFCVAEVV